MILSGVVIVGAATAGTLGAGVKAYRDLRRKKKYPWTVAAETLRVAKNELAGNRNRLPALSWRKSESRGQNTMRSLFEARHTQLKEISSTTDDDEKRHTRRKLNQNLAIASTSLGLACMGALFYPPLSLFSWAGFFYIAKQNLADAYNSLVERQTVGTDLLSSVAKILWFVNGQYVLCNLSAISYALNRKLFYEIKDNSSKNVIDVFRRSPRSVFVLSDGHEIEVPFEALKAGDIVVVNAGETIPIDGTITNGVASVDQHLLTGEPKSVEKIGR